MARSVVRQTLTAASVDGKTVGSEVEDTSRSGDIRIEDVIPLSVLALKLGQSSVISSKLADSLVMPGNVTKPEQSSFLSRKSLRPVGAFGTGGNNDHTGDEDPFPFTDGTDFNIGSNFNEATGVYTAPLVGKYAFTIGLQCTGAGGAPAAVWTVSLKTNLTQFNMFYIQTSGDYLSNSIIIPLVAGQTVQVKVDVAGAATWVDSSDVTGIFCGTLLN